MVSKSKWLLGLTTPLLLATLTACGIKQPNNNQNQANQANSQNSNSNSSNNQKSTTGTTKVNNDPLAGTSAAQLTGQSTPEWLHNKAAQIVKIVYNSNGTASDAYSKGFSDGSDNGQYGWSGNHKQSNNASNAMASNNTPNGIIQTKFMNNKYYKIGWLLSSAQGSDPQNANSFHGAQSEARYEKVEKNYNNGVAFINKTHEQKYAAFDDGDNQWFNHNQASIASTNY